MKRVKFIEIGMGVVVERDVENKTGLINYNKENYLMDGEFEVGKMVNLRNHFIEDNKLYSEFDYHYNNLSNENNSKVNALLDAYATKDNEYGYKSSMFDFFKREELRKEIKKEYISSKNNEPYVFIFKEFEKIIKGE